MKKMVVVSLAFMGTGALNIGQAVNLDSNGLGEVLIYPYYTVRNGSDTLLSIGNTTNNVKAIKIRFLEAENSREVLDFNLYLPAYSVWVSSLTSSETGTVLMTSSALCTVPAIPSTGVAFSNTAYSGQQADGGDTSLDRTREGYIEVIEMGVVADSSSFTPATAATPVNGTPPDCATLTAAWSAGGQWAINPNDGITFSPGGLKGNGVLINLNKSSNYNYAAAAIVNFASAANHTPPGALSPSLADNTGTSDVLTPTGEIVTSTWSNKIDAVSAVLMSKSIVNEYNTDTSLNAATNWVVTFPTKQFYVHSGSPNAVPPLGAPAGFLTTPIPATAPFTSFFTQGGACEEVKLAISTSPKNKSSLCWETNVITFNNAVVLESLLLLNVDTPADQESGMTRLFFPSVNGDHSITDSSGVIYQGLPVVGFSAEEFVNGTLIYGITLNHGFVRKIKAPTGSDSNHSLSSTGLLTNLLSGNLPVEGSGVGVVGAGRLGNVGNPITGSGRLGSRLGDTGDPLSGLGGDGIIGGGGFGFIF